MSPELISRIFDLYGKKPPVEKTVLQIMASLATKLADDTDFPPRKNIEYWGLILSACVAIGVRAEDITTLAQSYESFFPEHLLSLFGNIPFVIEGFQIFKLGDPEKVKWPLAALSVVAIAKLRGEV